MSAPTVTANRIEFRFELARKSFRLEVEAALAMRGITGVFGPSGSGKTSLLRCIAGLERADSALLRVAGDTWEDSAGKVNVASHKRAVAYVFQEPRLFPHLNVRKNLDYGHQRARQRVTVDPDQVIELLDLGSLLSRKPSGLSGGEAQRVAIGRALLRAPRFVLMDEPFASLDLGRKLELLPFIEKLHREFDIPVIYVSHSIDEICSLCDQLLVLHQGRGIAAGDLQAVLARTDLPLLGGVEAGAVLHGVVGDYDANYDLTRLDFAGGRLLAPGEFARGKRVRIRVRANDVSISRVVAEQSSILNRLEAVVTDIRTDSTSTVLVRLQSGEAEYLARITRRSADQLALLVGDAVIAQLKSVSVRQAF